MVVAELLALLVLPLELRIVELPEELEPCELVALPEELVVRVLLPPEEELRVALPPPELELRAELLLELLLPPELKLCPPPELKLCEPELWLLLRCELEVCEE